MSNQPVGGRVIQINVNPRGGVPKYAVPSTILGSEGVAGDKQRDKRHHGGPTRAVCLYALERIEALQSEGHPISAGSTGENLTLAGIDWATLQIGDRLAIGENIEVEITGYAAPCENIKESFKESAFTRISQKLHPGWSRLYARVVREGLVQQHDPIVLLGRGPH